MKFRYLLVVAWCAMFSVSYAAESESNIKTQSDQQTPSTKQTPQEDSQELESSTDTVDDNKTATRFTANCLITPGKLQVGGPITFSSFGTGVVQSNSSGVLSSTMGTDGQLLIGSSTGAPAWANLMSSDFSVTITNGPNSINLQTTGGGGGISLLVGNSGTAHGPIADVVGAAGGNITTTGDGANTLSIAVSGTTNNAVQIGNPSGSLSSVSVGASNTVLLGTGGAPTFGQVPNAALVNSSITLNNGSNITVTGSPVSLGGSATINLVNSPSVSGSLTAGTGITSTTGNIVATAGQVNAGTSVGAGTTITAGTGITSTTGNITASNGSIEVFNTSASSAGSDVDFIKNRSGGIITSGDTLGNITFQGFDGTQNVIASQIVSNSSGTIGAHQVASDLEFFTHPNSNTASTQRMTINSAGNVTINTPDSGVGLTINGGGFTSTGTTTLSSLGAGVVQTNASGVVTSTNGTNGQLLIGGGTAPAWANLTSTGGTVAITNGANTINLEAGGGVATTYNTDSGSATPSGGAITIHGGSNINTSGAGSTVTINLDNTVSVSGNITSTGGNIATSTGNITSAGSLSAGTGLTVTGGAVLTNQTLTLPAGSISSPSLIFSGSATGTGLSAPSANTLSFDVSGSEIFNVAAAGITVDAFSGAAGVVHNSAAGLLTSSLIVNADVAANAGIVDTKLGTIQTAGKVQNSATSATSSNTANTIVLRDGSGNFAAGTIAANLVGTVTGHASLDLPLTGGTLTGALVLPAGSGTTPSIITSLQFTGSSTGTGLSAVTPNVLSLDANGTAIMQISASGVTIDSFNTAGVVHNSSAGLLTSSLIVDADITNATITNDKLATISSMDIPGDIVVRDASGNFETNMITIDGTTTFNTDVATKFYVDQAVSLGLTVHTPAVAYDSSNFVSPPSGFTTIDGYTTLANDRILLNGQTNPVENGLWLAESSNWIRPTDFSNGTLAGKAYVLITNGNTFKGSSWVCNTPTSTIGTDSINFVEFALPNNTTGANVGVGTGQVYQGTSGQTLNFRTLLQGSYMTITTGTNEVTIAANGTSLNVANDLVARDGAGNFAAGTITAATGLNVTTGGATIEGNVLLQSQSALELQDSSASQNFVGIQAPAAVTASYTFSMPASAPTVGQVLQATSASATQWATIGGIPATAQTYYVSKTGSDSNNGSFAAPFLTVAHAVSVANGVASATTPVVIYIGAGTYIESNPISITSSGINIVGSSMTSTIIEPSPGSLSSDLFSVSTPIVNFYNFTMDTGQSTPTAGNAITYSVAASSEVEAGFHSLAINGFNIGISCNNSGGVITGIICDALQTAGNSTAISVISTNISITVENCIFTGPYTGFTPANTGISITGTATLATLLNNLYRYVVTGITTSGSANARVLGSNFESTTTSIMGSGASFTSIVGCDFINNNTGAVNIGLSGASTDAHIVGCNFQCAPDGGTATGTGVQVITGATVNVSACTIANAVLGLQAGQTGDTSSTSLKATSVILNTCTQDIVQHGSATLQFVGGTFDPITAGKVSVSNPATATFTAFDFANDAALSIGNSADSSQVIYEIYNGETTFPTLNYEPSYFGNKGTLYINSNAGDSVFTGVQSSSNNAYNYVVTGSRTNQAGIDLLSNTGSFGTTTSIRGWSITKLGSTDAPLAFNFFNSDNSGLATIPSYTLMQLDGAASQVSITASVNSTVAALSVTACPTGTGAGASITSNSSAPALLLTGSSTLIAPPLRMVGMPAAASSNFILAIDNSGNVTQTTITDTILGNIIVNGGQAGPLTIGTTNATSLAFVTSGANSSRLSIDANGGVTINTPAGGEMGLTIVGGGETITAGGLTVAAGGASITGTTTINTTGGANTSIGTGGTGAVNIGNSTGNTAVTGELTINPASGQTGLSVVGNAGSSVPSVTITAPGSGSAATMTGNVSAPTLSLTGNGSTTAPALRMTGVPAAASNNFILGIDASGNVTETSATFGNLANAIINGGQTGPLTIGTTNASVMTFEANNIVGMTVSAGNIGIGSEPTGLAPYTQLVVPGNVPSSAVGSTTTDISSPYSLYVQGRYAYVASFSNSLLLIFDVSNSQVPVLVNTGGTSTGTNPISVYVQGRYAYVGLFGSANFQVFDISDPASPQLISTTPTIGTGSYFVYVQGRYAYIAVDAQNKIQIFDISNPAAPVSVSSTATTTNGPICIYVQGRYAYITENTSGRLEIFDVSNPAAPISVNGSTTSTGTNPVWVYVQGRYAYVINFGSGTTNGLQIFDISNPASPVLVSSTPTGTDPSSVYVQGRYAYVTVMGTNTVQIFDVSNPAIPVSVGSINTNSGPISPVVQGRYLYLITQTGGSNSFQIFDVGGAYIQQLEAGGIEVGTLQTRENMTVNNDLTVVGGSTFARGFESTGPSAITASGSYASSSTASGWQPALTVAGQLYVPPMAPPSNISSSSTNGPTTSLYVQGRYVYLLVNGTPNTLQIFDTSNPASPSLISSTTTGSGLGGTSIYVQGRYAYAVFTSASILQVYDVSDPASPILVNTAGTSTGTNPNTIYVQGRYAYVVNGASDRLQIFDVSNPALPTLVNTAGTSTGLGPEAVYVQGKYAYVTNYNSGGASTLQITDVSNPASPITVSTPGTLNGAYAVYVQGRYAYVCAATANALQIFDVSNPASPTLVNTAGTSTGRTPVSIYVQGKCAYVANYTDATIQIFDVSNPVSPVSIGLMPVTGSNPGPLQLFVQGRYVYVVASNTGALQIFDLGGAYIQQLEAGGIEVGTLQTRENMTVNNDFAVVGGSTFGRGFESTGPSAITASGSYASSASASGWQPALTVAGQLYVPAVIPPSAVGSVTTGNAPSSVYVQGRYAYVVNGTSNTLQIIDVSNSSSPTAVNGTPGTATSFTDPFAVYVQGRYAYIVYGTSAHLEVFDVSNPASPVSVGFVATPGAIQGLYVQDRYAYLAQTGSNTLQIVDVSNPAAPVLAGSATAGTSPAEVYVQGKYAYLINNGSGATNGLQIFDVSNPVAPVIVNGTGTATGASPRGIYVQGRYAYITNNAATNSLQIFDVSNPVTPVAVGSFNNAAGFDEVYVQGRYAYVTNRGSNALFVFDVSTPTAPIQIGSVGTGSSPFRLFVQGRYVYLVNSTSTGTTGFQIFDVGGAYIQQLEAGGIEVGTLATRENMTVNNDLCVVGGSTFARGFESTGPSSITASGSYASSSTASGWQPALTVAGQLYVPAMAPPAAVGSVSTGAANYSYIQGRYLYQLNGSGSFQIIDVSNSSTPLVLSTTSLPSSSVGRNIYVQGKYAYITGQASGFLYIYDVSNPIVPTLANGTGTSTGGVPVGLYVQGRYAYITNNTSNTLQIFDVSSIQDPVLVGSVSTINSATGSLPFAVYVQGIYAYVVCRTTSNQLQIYDVSNPAAPLFKSQVTTGTDAFDVYVQGRYAYVLNTTGSLQIFDVSNPSSIPAAVGSYPLAGTSIVVQGRYAYVASDSTVNTIIDVSTPSSPTFVGTFSTTVSGNIRTVVQGRYAYASCNGSLQVFDLGGAYIQQFEAGTIEVGTLATRENMTVNNDLCVVGGSTFGRGFESTGPSAITASGSYASSSTASGWQPALTVAGQLYVPASVPPSAVGSTTTNINSPYSLYVQGRYAYVASFSNSLLLIFDVSNSQVPVLVNTGGTSTGTNPISVYVQGRYAYVGLFGSANFQVFDISDPASPQLISTTPTVGTGSYFVYVQGRYAYIAVDAQNKIQIFDISNPTAPVSVSSTATTTNSPICIYVQGRYAYITENASGRLEIFDVSNPAAPISVNGSTTSTGTNPVWVYVQGRYAYVINFGSGTSNGLQIFDISNPASPVLVSSTPTGTDPSSVYVQGRYAYVTVMGTNTVQIFDVSNPATPVSVGSINTNNGPISPVVQGRYLYLITQAGGSNSFQIFDVGGAYIQQLEAGGIEVGTLATRENMTVNNDLCVVGGATFGRGFESTGTSAITGSSFTASPIPALIITGGSASANSTPLRLINVPTAASTDDVLTIDSLGNVKETTTTLSNFIINGGQPGALTIGTNNSTTLTLETNSASGLSIDTSQNVNVTNNLLLPNSTSTVGVIKLGGNAFIANYGSDNTFVGQTAGNTSLSGNSNTCIGADAGTGLTSGSSNVFIGSGTGDSITSGSNNVFLGTIAGGANTGSNNIAIGYNTGVSGTGSNVLQIGGGTGTGAGELNQAFISGIYNATGAGGVTVFCTSSGQLYAPVSSKRYKKDIVDLASVKAALKKLRPVTFKYTKESVPADEVQYGLIAEEVEKVLPEFIAYNKDGQPELVRYHLFDAIFIKALQELIAQNEELEKHLSDQQERLEKQEILQKYLIEQVAKLTVRNEQDR